MKFPIPKQPKHLVDFLQAARDGDLIKLRRVAKRVGDLDVLICDEYIEYCTALMWAAFRGRIECVKFLLENGASVHVGSKHPYYAEPQRQTALHFAAATGRTQICKLLIEHGAKVDAVDSSKTTPIRSAVLGGHIATVELLLDSGADLSKRQNLEVLSSAIFLRNKFVNDKPVITDEKWQRLITLLLDRGVDVTGINGATSTPLMSATEFPELTIELLRRGANPDVQQKDGWTALMLAANLRRYPTVKALLNAGAKREFKNRDGMTALDIAKRTRNKQIIKLLSNFK